MDTKLTAAERLPSSKLVLSTHWHCGDVPQIWVANAWKAHNKKFEQAAVDQSCKRAMDARLSAVAADTSNAVVVATVCGTVSPWVTQRARLGRCEQDGYAG